MNEEHEIEVRQVRKLKYSGKPRQVMGNASVMKKMQTRGKMTRYKVGNDIKLPQTMEENLSRCKESKRDRKERWQVKMGKV